MIINKISSARKYLLGGLVWCLYRSLSLTWRIQLVEPESLKQRLKNREPIIFAHWHGDESVLVSLVKKYRIATITSTSKDGEIMTALIGFLGGITSRGSSSRGAAGALKGLIRLVRDEKCNSSFAVDGPRGPLYQVKPGVFEFSRLAKAPIYAGGVACDRKWVFDKAWNKAFLPKPFARVVIEWQQAFEAMSRTQAPRDEKLANELAQAIHGARQNAFEKM